METVFRDYSPKGVRFVYLYKALAHPELNGYVNPVTLAERLLHIREAKRTLGSQIPWIADSMANDLKRALGNRQNSEYLLDPRGRVLRVRAWSSPDELRRDLEESVGPVDSPTQVSDLSMRVQPAPEHAPTGVVPRISKPGSYRTLISRPQFETTEEPFYTKLRAEAEQSLLANGAGKLYLAFLLDPLHGVHWNNRAPEMEVILSAPEGIHVAPETLRGPSVEADADADPREFLADVNRGESREPLNLKFRYFACTETWCRPVTQEYLITWDVDRDAGRVRPGRMDFNRAPRQGRGPGGRRGQGGRPIGPVGALGSERALERLLAGDLDGDGRLTPDELPEQMRPRFDRIDQDRNGYADPPEIEAMMQRSGRGGRPGGPVGLMRRDADGDGKLSMEEFPPQMERRFRQLDTNGDGVLDRQELSAMASRGLGPRESRPGN